MKKFLFVCGCSAVTAFGQMRTEPTWDLKKDAGALSAELKEKGSIPLSPETAFSVPHTAIKDHSAFTVTAKLRFDSVEERTQFMLFDQTTGETGFGLSMSFFPAVGSPIILTGNGVQFNSGWFRSDAGQTHTFTIAARKGIVTVYMDDRVLKRFFTVLTPNLEPIWVGRTKLPNVFKNVHLLELAFYGPDEEFFAKGESKDFAEGYKGGKGWLVRVPIESPATPLPRLLYYGDSISGGYNTPLLKLLKDKAYGYHWSGFVSNAGNLYEKPFLEVGALVPFDMVVFNNGLHSLHWTPDKVTDQQIIDVTRGIVQAFRKASPKAKLVWLSTTPHTARRQSKDEIISRTGDKNPIVIRINTLAEKVMKEEGVDIIDGYGLLIGHLDLAAGDEYHWKGPAYEILAKAIADKFFQHVAK